MQMQKYSRLPGPVKAYRVSDILEVVRGRVKFELPEELEALRRKNKNGWVSSSDTVYIPTEHGELAAGKEDVLVLDETTGFYIVPLAIFDDTYKAVSKNHPATAKQLVKEVAPKGIAAWECDDNEEKPKDNVVPLNNGTLPTPAAVAGRLAEFVVAFAQMKGETCKTLVSNTTNAEMAYAVLSIQHDCSQIMFGDDSVEDA